MRSSGKRNYRVCFEQWSLNPIMQSRIDSQVCASFEPKQISLGMTFLKTNSIRNTRFFSCNQWSCFLAVCEQLATIESHCEIASVIKASSSLVVPIIAIFVWCRLLLLCCLCNNVLSECFSLCLCCVLLVDFFSCTWLNEKKLHFSKQSKFKLLKPSSNIIMIMVRPIYLGAYVIVIWTIWKLSILPPNGGISYVDSVLFELIDSD